MLLEVLLQPVNVHFRPAYQISDDQNYVFRVLPDNANAVGNPRTIPDRILNFTEFDPPPPNLYLMILSPEVLNIAVRQPARNIAGSINSFAPIARIVDELFIRQRLVIQVASGKPDPGNA